MDNDVNIFREVNDKSDIVRVISYYLGNDAIVKAGKGYKCICPFHNDSHPSMQINPEKNYYHCFSCGAGGDSIKFVEEYAHLSPLESLKKVCEICSIPIPSQASGMKEKRDLLREKYPRELDALLELGKLYSLFLTSNDGNKGREYLSSRKIGKDTIDHFGIGLSPYDPTFAISSLRNEGFDVPTLERAGILSNSAELKDRYSGRIMFPIADNDGHIVGFSGRKILDTQDGGKYINYPETELFRKGSILYHFDKAKETARRDGYLYILEGFMDVIAMQRAGLYSACGLMGTALSQDHVQAIKSLGVEVRLLLDSDEAGQLGEERALPLLMAENIPVRVCWKFDKAKDADEVLTRFGKDELIRQVNRLYSPTLFLLGRALKGRKILSDSREIEAFIAKSRPFFQKESEIDKARDLKAISKRTDLDVDELSLIYSGKGVEKSKEKPYYRGERNIGKKNYRWGPDYVHVEKRLPIALAGKYESPQAFEVLFTYLCENLSAAKKDFGLYRTEYEVAFVLPQDRRAYESFRMSRIVFDLDSFNVFSDLVGNIYLEDETLKAFSAREYDRLLSQLSGSSQNQEKEEEEDPFDLEGLEEEEVDLSPDKKSFLCQMIAVQKNLQQSWYDERKFQSSLNMLNKLLACKRFEDDLHLKKSGNEEKTIEELQTKKRLEEELKKASQNH